jgi:hypothetical protein
LKSKHGRLTGEFGLWLTHYLQKNRRYQNLAIFYDHGDKQKHQNVAAIKGFCGENVTKANKLADVDVIVVNENNEAIILIEREESKVRPKALLGDVFALLYSDRFAVARNQQQLYFDVSPATKLLIAAVDTTNNAKQHLFEKDVRRKLEQSIMNNESVQIRDIEFIFGPDADATIDHLVAKIKEIFPD